MNNKIHLVECPRDAMQGWTKPISTEKKIEYLNLLLKVGFGTIDAGSFVSPKAIPQMADTNLVIQKLEVRNSKSKLLVIVANLRGAEEAVVFDEISYLGFPLSVSPTFQARNTNSSIESSLQVVEEIRELCIKNNKQPVVYISMGFGNSYGDPYNEDIVMKLVTELVETGIPVISLADTVGLATPSQVTSLFNLVTTAFPNTQFGVHLHSLPHNWKAKVDAALMAGCSRFDGAINGIGGCPMANNELVGNMDTIKMVSYFNELGLLDKFDMDALARSVQLADKIFV